ncbi:hypothetical protein FHS31_000818 [Sphingomonas vulcanisoli]|uniref:Uncharacterized protein n=1 Tax=Sphingomonas vulcanisoli TaxID=1658060 RepID=A0ABX0TNW6_9SPHN|nr:hypothetical protein [Sphingomonas vulcanisoli]
MVSREQVIARTDQMRAMSDTDRAAAIAASPKIIGFARFQERAKQQQLRSAYRAPPIGGPDGPSPIRR